MSVNQDRAFPRAGCTWTEDHGDDAFAQDGMTLRDYFAAKAMQSLLLRGWVGDDGCESPNHYSETAEDDDGSLCGPDVLSRDSYCIADAMLRARKVEKEQ